MSLMDCLAVFSHIGTVYFEQPRALGNQFFVPLHQTNSFSDEKLDIMYFKLDSERYKVQPCVSQGVYCYEETP